MASRRLLSTSPATKKAREDSRSSGGGGSAGGSSGNSGQSPDGFQLVGEPITGRCCPDPACEGTTLVWRTNRGRRYAACPNNDRDDPESCKFTANKLARAGGKELDPSLLCVLCLASVVNFLSIGKKNGKVNSTTQKDREFPWYPAAVVLMRALTHPGVSLSIPQQLCSCVPRLWCIAYNIRAYPVYGV